MQIMPELEPGNTVPSPVDFDGLLDQLAVQAPPSLRDLPEQVAVDYNGVSRRRAKVGLLLAGAALALAAIEISGAADDSKITYPLNYRPQVQEFVIGLTDDLSKTGEVLLPLGLLVIGASGVAAASSKRLRAIDQDSSSEMAEGGHNRNGAVRRVLEVGFSGTLPVMATVAVTFASFASSLGTEISEGPSRPIRAIGEYSAGNAWVVQSKNMNPMEQSNLTPELVVKLADRAQAEGINVSAFDLSLGDVASNGQNRTSLAVGLPGLGPNSGIDWEVGDSCQQIPILVDGSSGLNIGDTPEVNGVVARVVAIENNISAINRVGVVMDKDAMTKCVTHSGNYHAVTLDTTPEKANELLQEVNTGPEQQAATVITKEQYIANSVKFWEQNSKPNTNTLALAGLIVALVATTSLAGRRIMSSRREIATRLSFRVSERLFRTTEILRATKEGVLSSVVGIIAAIAVTPLANSIESSTQFGVTYKDAFVGAAIGMLGTINGALLKVAPWSKIVRRDEDTKV